MVLFIDGLFDGSVSLSDCTRSKSGRDLEVTFVLYSRQHPCRETNKALSEQETEALQIEPTCTDRKFPEVFSSSPCDHPYAVPDSCSVSGRSVVGIIGSTPNEGPDN